MKHHSITSPPCHPTHHTTHLTAEKQYQEIKDHDALHELLVEYLDEYNLNFSPQMNLVFFADAIAHLSRICRILKQPRGNALLVGVGGSGRQSLTRLAAAMNEYVCRSIEIRSVEIR